MLKRLVSREETKRFRESEVKRMTHTLMSLAMIFLAINHMILASNHKRLEKENEKLEKRITTLEQLLMSKSGN